MFDIIFKLLFGTTYTDNFLAPILAKKTADEREKETADFFFNKLSPEQYSDPAALDDFIRQFPYTMQARFVFAHRYHLLEKMPSIEGYNEFIVQYPDTLQAQVAIQEVFKLYRYQNRVAGYYDFIKRYPNTQQAVVAMMRIQELMFEYVCKLDKEEEYDAFISAFPSAPQVEEALKRAYEKAFEKEKNEFDKYKKGDSKPTDVEIEKTINRKVTDWQLEVNKFKKKYPNLDISDKASDKEKNEVRNQLFKIDRRADVLQTLYAEYNGIGRIQPTRDNLDIITRLDKIQQTLETNHKELLAKLDEETNRICDKLEQLHLDNQQIVQELRNGFTVIHQDMVDIKDHLKDIKGTLDKMDLHLEAINSSIVEGFTQTNEAITKIFMHIYSIPDQTGFEAPAQLQREQFAELRTQSTHLTDLAHIANNGYNSIGNLWDSQYAADQASQMNKRFSSTGSGSSKIAQFVGSLASAATSFIPYIGPCIAPAVGRFTEKLVDDVAIPCVQELFADITDPNDRRALSDKCLASAQKMGSRAVKQLGEALPVVWQEEKRNLLNAAMIISNKVGIPEDISKSIIAAADSGNMDPIIDELAKISGIEKGVIKAVFEASNSSSLRDAATNLAKRCNIQSEALTYAAEFVY